MAGADTIIRNGRILTMNPLAPRAQALAVANGRIIAIGSNGDIEALRERHTKVIDAQGASVLPGFVESHLHLFGGAADLDKLQLFSVFGFAALQKALRNYAATRPDEALLVAKGANYLLLGEKEPLTRHHLDQMVPDRPVILFAPDHHTAWANTIALERAGLLHGRDVGVGNEVVMGSDGLANGELREGEAIRPVLGLRNSGGRERLGLEGVEPDSSLTASERDKDAAVLKRGLAYCASHGITSFHNMDGNFYQLELLKQVEDQGDLLCRAEVPFHLTNSKPLSSLEQASEMHRRFASDMLKSGRVKIFIDGVLDSRTAVMVEDYGDKPCWRGEPLFSDEAFNEAAIEIDRRGLQISVHAIGDGAVRSVLNGYEAAQRANGKRDSRHRIEHIEVVHPEDIGRFAELGVIASMQPPHPPGTMGLPLEPTVSAIGRHRWPHSYAWRSIWNAGARICFASDWPVSPIEPILGIHAAVTRKKWADDMPDQSASLMEAIAGYTIDGAYTQFMEDKTGTLESGKYADIVILSQDLEAIDPEAIASVTPVLTMCGGRITHEA
ncbi:MAG: amidohydrolase [Rhizobiaceae bacterium]